MLYQPTQIIPSTLSGVGDGVIDALLDLEVSWQVNGLEPLLAYQIVIYQNDSASTEMLGTGKVTLGTPFYGSDKNGNVQLFTATAITAAALASAGIVNGYANGYKLIITQWWTATDYVTQTSASVFYTRTTPTLVIDPIADPVASKSLTITATYAQAQGDAISWVEWMFANASDTDNPIDDTGTIETAVLEYDCDGLFSNTKYAIRLIVQTQSGVQVDTGWVEFDVLYTMSPSEGVVSVCRTAGENYIEVTWIDRTVIEGAATGSYTINDGVLMLPSGSSILWDENGGEPIVFGIPWSFATRLQLTDATTCTSVITVGSLPMTLTVDTSGVTLEYDGTTIFTESIAINRTDWITITISPTEYNILQETSVGGLLPSTTLYPSGTLYPSASAQEFNTFTGEITYTQLPVSAIAINGAQTCEYFWLYSGDFNSVTVANLMGESFYEPVYDGNTYFLINFMNGLFADTTGGNGDVLSGAAVYRRASTESTYTHLVDIESGILVMRDYGAKSKTTYQYSVFPKGADTYTGLPYISSMITPIFGGYTLMECSQDSEGVYHIIAQYPFVGNINGGSVSNNNNPQLLENFTRYPNRQPSSQHYRTGTLDALIGYVDQATSVYVDTWALADEIYELSVSTNPKFLKDMKGALWMVETSAATNMRVNDKNVYMPITMTLPWVEVGSADSVSIVSIPGDPLWETDQIALTTVSIDPITGYLSWTIPDDYMGSVLSLNATGSLLQTGTGFIVPATMSIAADGSLLATI